MTEAEWNAFSDPTPMLEFLSGIGSERKRRLFLCACCKTFWHLLVDERSKKAVENTDAFADNLPGLKLDSIWFGVNDAYESVISNQSNRSEFVWEAGDEQRIFAFVAREVSFPRVYASPDFLTLHRGFAGPEYEPPPAELLTAFCNCQVTVARELFGPLPFRSVTLNPAWLTSTVLSLAQGIYDEKAFDRMPILADALEDAGCNNQDILTHCRQAGEHVKGCWAVDLILGKE